LNIDELSAIAFSDPAAHHLDDERRRAGMSNALTAEAGRYTNTSPARGR
jgi:hypothetical protein